MMSDYNHELYEDQLPEHVEVGRVGWQELLNGVSNVDRAILASFPLTEPVESHTTTEHTSSAVPVDTPTTNSTVAESPSIQEVIEQEARSVDDYDITDMAA